MPDSPLVGYRTQLTACILGLWSAARVFGLVHVTEEQATAINGLLLGGTGLFLALKVGRLHAAVTSATAEAPVAAVISDVDCMKVPR